ncbi:MAG: archaellar assembly protein FlaJ [Methanosarcinales archaeon]|nr:archaellar assembly protein FlaJ [Methanosarcinales archaeon]
MEFKTTIKESLETLNLNLNKVNFDVRNEIKQEQAIMYDLLGLLTYMASISTADISRSKLFELSGSQDGIASKYLNRIYTMVENYGYDYSNACKLVSENIEHPELRNFLVRFSNALNTGEEEEKFLRGEADRMVEIYTNSYLNDVEQLKKWGDAHSALITSLGMVIAIFLITTWIFPFADLFSMIIATGSIFFLVCFFGTYIIFKVAPFETVVHSLDVKSKKQQILSNISKISLAFIFIIPPTLLIFGVSVWIVFLCASIFMAPIGIVAVSDSSDLEKVDADTPHLLKNLGSTAGIMGTTLSKALSQIDKQTVVSLEDLVTRLEKRLINGIEPLICWYYFRGESGSELINKYINVFIDATTLGGNPTKIGEVTSQASLGIVLLRVRRKLVSKSFMNLTLLMHLVISGLMLFIYQILYIFTNAMLDMRAHQAEMIATATAGAPAGIGFFDMGEMDLIMIEVFVFSLIFLFSVANASAIKFAIGGNNYTVFFYGAILFFISAIVIFIVPLLSDLVFTIELGGGIPDV